MPSISNAAARDDLYDLTELAVANQSDAGKIAKIAQALERSIPRLDPVRFRGEFEHVLRGPDIPQLVRAKEMARAALEGRLTDAGYQEDDVGADLGLFGRLQRFMGAWQRGHQG